MIAVPVRTWRKPLDADKVKPPVGEVFLVKDRCKGCGFCVEFCPLHVLEMSHDYNAKGYHYPVAAKPEACSGCDLCGMYCPDFAIYGFMFKKKPK